MRLAARLLLVGTALALATEVVAAPIRVATFAGVGSGRFWHTSTHTAASAITSVLARPDTANIGPNLVIHPTGIITARFGVTSTGGGTPTAVQKQAFIDALDTIDVAVFINIVDIGNIISDPVHRARLESFSKTKGVVSLHQTLDTYGTWPAWDTLQGARFQNHPSSDRQATIRLDTSSSGDPAGLFLNGGLPDTARFLDEWLSFTTNATIIRAKSNLKVTVNIDESSYAGGMGGARAMGADHPMSWYRQLPEGGRFFFTSIGHRAQTYLGTTNSPTTPESSWFLRRQLYNAILWAGGYDVTTAIQARGTEVSGGKFGDHARIRLSVATLTVSLLHNGAHTVEILALDGRRIDSRRDAARGDHTFTNLSPGVHVVAVTSPIGRHTRLVNIP